MNIILGFLIVGCSIFGGFMYMGCSPTILLAPSEYVILLGAALGVFITSNPFYVSIDTIRGTIEAVLGKSPKEKDYIILLGLLYSLMREMRAKSSSEVEVHIENPEASPIFQRYPKILKNKMLLNFICDYCRLITMGNARPFEIESLMDEEIEIIVHDGLKPSSAVHSISEALPALGIVAAVLGIIKALGFINENPAVLGHAIGSALVGTFGGVLFAYGFFAPLAIQLETVRYKQSRLFVVVKQTLLAYMNGAMPPIAIEYGRKTISAHERPSIEKVENETISSGNT